ncbi:MAG TPA: SAF domain-containing protein [Pyrinomonadaceae bacterium]|jgi:flagella basal body P-ring formation protein FlgA
MDIEAAEAAKPVELLTGIQPDEVAKLRAAHIHTLGELWVRTGADTNDLTKFETAAKESKLSAERLAELLPDRLVCLLADHVLARAKRLGLEPPPEPKSSWLDAIVRWLSRLRLYVRPHLFDGLLLLLALTLALLALRALGYFASSALGLRDNVIAAARPLRAGHVLRAADLMTVRLPAAPDYFPAGTNLEGLLLLQDVAAQKPLRLTHLQRLQVVAKKTVPAGQIVAADAVTLDWTVYEPDAALKTEDVVGKQARYALKEDNVVLTTALEKPPPPPPTPTPSPTPAPPH